MARATVVATIIIICLAMCSHALGMSGDMKEIRINLTTGTRRDATIRLQKELNRAMNIAEPTDAGIRPQAVHIVFHARSGSWRLDCDATFKPSDRSAPPRH